jgi:hypothetical protein
LLTYIFTGGFGKLFGIVGGFGKLLTLDDILVYTGFTYFF